MRPSLDDRRNNFRTLQHHHREKNYNKGIGMIVENVKNVLCSNRHLTKSFLMIFYWQDYVLNRKGLI